MYNFFFEILIMKIKKLNIKLKSILNKILVFRDLLFVRYD